MPGPGHVRNRRALLDHGARRAYAADVGHGQLLGSLAQDVRVVNLEGTNLAALDDTLVPEAIEVVTVDVSYISLAAAVPQLDHVRYAHSADLVALVKPQFELGLAQPPHDPEGLQLARQRAVASIQAVGREVVESIESPLRGSRGAVEFFVHARRAMRTGGSGSVRDG